MINNASLLKMLLLPYRFMQITNFRLIIVFALYPMVHLEMLDILMDTIQMVINFKSTYMITSDGHPRVEFVLEVVWSERSEIIIESLMCMSYIITRIWLYCLSVIDLIQLEGYELYILMVYMKLNTTLHQPLPMYCFGLPNLTSVLHVLPRLSIEKDTSGGQYVK